MNISTSNDELVQLITAALDHSRDRLYFAEYAETQRIVRSCSSGMPLIAIACFRCRNYRQQTGIRSN
jgi:hypothetical protein